MGSDLLNLPDDDRTRAEGERVGLSDVVIVRDVVRLVEVVHLREQQFFNKRSVLAGSMALRSFGSPRFTVFDADFSTSAAASGDPGELLSKMTYRGDRLDIEPETVRPDAKRSLYTAEPITFDARFSLLVPEDQSRFKADISFRGLVLDGLETTLQVPYELDLWDDPPVVFVMDPHEIVAEKILGWALDRRVKHYADLAYIAHVAANEPGIIRLDNHKLRTTLDEKLRVMKKVHPGKYERFNSIDPLIADLDNRNPALPQGQWRQLQYVNGSEGMHSRDFSLAPSGGCWSRAYGLEGAERRHRRCWNDRTRAEARAPVHRGARI